MLAADLPEAVVRWREGVDFTDAREAAALAGGERTVTAVPAWAVMLMGTLRELRLHEATGQLPGGKAYTAQPAWKVELWEAYWQVRAW